MLRDCPGKSDWEKTMDGKTQSKQPGDHRGSLRLPRGKRYIGPTLERRLFFILTLVMLLAGIVYRFI